MKLIALCIVVMLALTIAAQTTNECDTTDKNTCASRTRAKGGDNKNCVWLDQRCQSDPCARHDKNNVTCRADPLCVSSSWLYNGAMTCMSYELLCTKLPAGEACDQSGLCRTEQTNCVWGLPTSTGAPGENKDPECLSFPFWSIALIVVWVIIMAILVFIVLILKKKKHQEAIKGVEQENEVVVDSLHINDNFQPQATTTYSQPLATNQM